MADKLKPGTLVLVAGKLVTVQRAERKYGADGYMIHDGGAYTHHVQDWQIKPARIGATVCAEPHGSHWCGLLHLDAVNLERVRAQG